MSFARLVPWQLILALLAPLNAAASVQTLTGLHDAGPVGSGTLTWFGFTLYEATLYAPEGRYRADRPHALQIDYARGFSREQLAQRTLEEIERLHGSQQNRAALLERLTALFPDVAPGDQLIGVHYPGRSVAFYRDGVLLGRLDDPEVAAAFFGIWLDPRTREQSLRAGLLGER